MQQILACRFGMPDLVVPFLSAGALRPRAGQCVLIDYSSSAQ
jgi:hypothetical protein